MQESDRVFSEVFSDSLKGFRMFRQVPFCPLNYLRTLLEALLCPVHYSKSQQTGILYHKNQYQVFLRIPYRLISCSRMPYTCNILCLHHHLTCQHQYMHHKVHSQVAQCCTKQEFHCSRRLLLHRIHLVASCQCVQVRSHVYSHQNRLLRCRKLRFPVVLELQD